MFIITTIKSDNEGLEFSAVLDNGRYANPTVTFYSLRGDWKTPADIVVEIWDKGAYLIDELYPLIVRSCKIGMLNDWELRYLLEESKNDMYTLKDMLTQGIKMGFFDTTECEFFT
jgi:hypothetical protein